MNSDVTTFQPLRAQGLGTARVSIGTPIGILTVEGNDSAITGIELPHSEPRRARSGPPGSDRRAHRDEAPPPVLETIRQLGEYFEGERSEFDVPMELSGSAFQCDVWLALANIPYGKTVSYGELAMMVGRPRAFRAVGQANGANPIPIVLPCHRVIASGGKIGGYGGGLPTKRRLLELEGASWRD